MIQTTELDRKSYQGPKPPAYLSRLLTKIGGTNLFDEPHFRLVWAPERLTPSGGTWVDWKPGMAVADRNRRLGNVPWRQAIGVRMIPRYGPIVGWALERWVPARAYGSREQWYAPAVIGGTMILCDPAGLERIPSQGSFPARGDYEYTGFLFANDELAEATVVPAMQALIRELENLPVNPQRRVAMRVAVARAAQEATDALQEQKDLDVIASFQPAFHGQPMSGYGPKKAHSMINICKKLGISSHPGVS